MRRIIIAAWSLSLFASVQAAQVSVVTPDGAGNLSYIVGGQSYTALQNETNVESLGSAAHEARRSDTGLVSLEANGGEELIWLGAHETTNYSSTGGVDNDVVVVLNNLNAGSAETAGVSLLFSAAEDLAWDVTVDAGVKLNNIYVFGLQEQSITVNGEQVLEDDIFDLFGEIGSVHRSPVAIFGETFCVSGQSSSDCSTDSILGINHQGSGRRGAPTHTNSAGNTYLADLGVQQITSFSGSYFADGFTVGVDSTVVPLPAALLLFASAFSLLLGRKFYSQSHTG